MGGPQLPPELCLQLLVLCSGQPHGPEGVGWGTWENTEGQQGAHHLGGHLRAESAPLSSFVPSIQLESRSPYTCLTGEGWRCSEDPVLRRLTQENCSPKASLGYRMRTPPHTPHTHTKKEVQECVSVGRVHAYNAQKQFWAQPQHLIIHNTIHSNSPRLGSRVRKIRSSTSASAP